MAGWVSIALVAVACTVVGAALCVICWWVPKFQMRRLTFENDKDRAATEDNFRKTVGQVIGGAAVLVAAGLAYLQFTQQQQASRDLLISNQVSKGFEQLAGDKVAMRLGGIYALEGVMKTSSEYHQPVLEALCAFVRDSTIGMIVNETPATTDIQAALTVIGRRKEGAGRVDLSRAVVFKADLTHANLRDADLRNADLLVADLSDADLRAINLSRGATLRDTNLSGARGVNLSGADLSHANLEDADLAGARGLVPAQLAHACGQPKVLPPDFPAGFRLRDCPADWGGTRRAR